MTHRISVTSGWRVVPLWNVLWMQRFRDPGCVTRWLEDRFKGWFLVTHCSIVHWVLIFFGPKDLTNTQLSKSSCWMLLRGAYCPPISGVTGKAMFLKWIRPAERWATKSYRTIPWIHPEYPLYLRLLWCETEWNGPEVSLGAGPYFLVGTIKWLYQWFSDGNIKYDISIILIYWCIILYHIRSYYIIYIYISIFINRL